MATSSSSVITTPLAHADNQGEGHPRGTPLQYLTASLMSVFLTYCRNQQCMIKRKTERSSDRIDSTVLGGGEKAGLRLMSLGNWLAKRSSILYQKVFCYLTKMTVLSGKEATSLVKRTW
ncbi:hypothetical protein TNCV_4155531 [Trichonephila clavipes]|nr:hypothetical protein TNCV_4155531 [Trichonephila clavipes]